MKVRLYELISHYEELLKAKDQEISCAYAIMRQLEEDLRKARSGSDRLKASEEEHRRLASEQKEAIEYLRGRENQLVREIKKVENDMFILTNSEEKTQQDENEPPFTFSQRQRGSSVKVLEPSPLQIRRPKPSDIKMTLYEEKLAIADIRLRVSELRGEELRAKH